MHYITLMGRKHIVSTEEMRERMANRRSESLDKAKFREARDRATQEGFKRAENVVKAAEDSIVALHRKMTDAENAQTRSVMDSLVERHGVEPADELMRMVMERNDQGRFVLSEALRVKILLELHSYRAPKMRATENHHVHDHNVLVVQKNFSGGRERVIGSNLEVPEGGLGDS